MPALKSPFDDPVPRGFRVVLATLRIAVTLGCWGTAMARLSRGDDFGLTPLLALQAGFTPATADALLDNIARGLAVCGLLTLVRPCWPVLLPVTAWFVFVAAAGPLFTGEPFRPATHAARYLTPLALLLLDFWPPRTKFSIGRAMVALLLLRLGIIVTFAAEGVLAILQSRAGGPLAAQLATALERVVRWSAATEQAQTALGVVGGLYLGLALGLLLVRSRGISLLMTLCGAMGAMTYVIAGGADAWPQTLLHAVAPGAAFALFLYWWLAVKEQPAITVPA